MEMLVDSLVIAIGATELLILAPFIPNSMAFLHEHIWVGQDIHVY